ncbi:hypothetical protein [Bremerella sp. P1]|uniref:hypothetical protein n=1 Tax=Bremerella sp. P1 TaxID=3026424 RepID=UPI002368551C|nr:hypothetical protein [Bremerella sp. P1]WDI43159.1 hypothetical protein PSR63_04270 [Bremerella sp. P1]
MPKDPINPFQSPQASPDEAPSVVSAVAEEEWPFEATELAVIEEIEPPLGRPIVPGRSWGKIISFSLLSIVGCYGLWIGVMVLIAWLSGNSDAMNSLLIHHVTSLLFVVLPAVLFLLTISRHYFQQDVSTFRRLAKLLRLRETKPIPSLNSPNCQFVAIVPRERWQFSELDVTQEVAVLHINPYESRIILEGAKHRFWIPSHALLKCGVDYLTKSKKEIWVVCLIIQTENGPREVCLRVGNVDGFWQSNGQRKSVAEKYWGRIMLLKKAPRKSTEEN